MINNIKKIKSSAYLWAFFVLIVFFIIYKGINPSGHKIYTANLKDNNYFISPLSPVDRMATGSNQEIVSNPVYFSLRTLRKYNQAKMIVEYENSSQPIVDAGVLVDNRIWRYKLQPLENMHIDKLISDGWSVVREKDLVLLQRKNTFKNIEDFLQSPPVKNEIALYNYSGADVDSQFVLPDYIPKNDNKVIEQQIRGNYQFFTYLKNEELNFNFQFFSLNKNKDKDNIDVNLYYENNLIESRHLTGQMKPNDWGNIEQIGEIDLKMPSLLEGAYKVEIKANDDVVTNKITTKQSKIAFLNKIWLYHSSNNKSMHVYTDCPEISFNTVNPGSLQTILIDSLPFKIDKTYRQFIFKTINKINDVELENNDMILAGNGVFSLDKNDIFNPSWKQVDKDFHSDGVNYVLAKYNSPKIIEQFKVSQAVFDLKSAYSELDKSIIPGVNVMSRKYSFMFSIPSLRGEGNGSVKIKNIKLELIGDNWKQVINKIFHKIIK